MCAPSDKAKTALFLAETGQRLQGRLPRKGANKGMRHAGVFNSNKVGCLKPSPKSSRNLVCTAFKARWLFHKKHQNQPANEQKSGRRQANLLALKCFRENADQKWAHPDSCRPG